MIDIDKIDTLAEIFTWDDENLDHYESAFYGNYMVLEDLIDCCYCRFKTIEIPRVGYLFYTQYFYVISSQVGITIECLFKSLLIEAGIDEKQLRKMGHSLVKLFNSVKHIENPGENAKYAIQCFGQIFNLMEEYDSCNMFVNMRYHENSNLNVDLYHMSWIKPLIMALSNIYKEFYQGKDWIDLTYGSMVD